MSNVEMRPLFATPFCFLEKRLEQDVSQILFPPEFRWGRLFI